MKLPFVAAAMLVFALPVFAIDGVSKYTIHKQDEDMTKSNLSPFAFSLLLVGGAFYDRMTHLQLR